ncbi:MAG: KAP family P-loop domain protein [Wenzhouxiangellaceae bacterium]
MLIPDYETEVDFLNCEAIAITVAEVLRSNRNQPLTIGIHGDWGAGKSSILKMIESDLSADENVAVLWFNGWTFEGFDDAKTVLIESTITELIRQRPITTKAKKLASKLLRRVDWLKIAKRGSGLAFNAITGVPSPDQLHLALGALADTANDAAEIDPDQIPARLDEIAGFLKPSEDGENVPETIHAFREEFRELLVEAKIDQLVVLIDDLDRCLPATAIETLEAIRLFLFVPKTAFVIGADEAMIEYAVRQHFPDLPQSSGPLTYARNYLEKLVQIPFRIPTLGAHETRAYVTLLLVQSIVGEEHEGFKNLLAKVKEDLRQPWLGVSLSQSDVQAVARDKREQLDTAFVLAQRIAPMLAEGTKGNPRQIKRFLNALLVRQIIAEARGFGNAINQPTLAKLMLAERFQSDFYDHVALQVMSAASGISTDLAVLESADEERIGSPKKKKKQSVSKKQPTISAQESNVPETKWRERDWLQRWRAIEPLIGDIDLRPYVFVARDKRVLGSGIAGAQETLISKLCGNKLTIRAAESEVKALMPGDADIVFAGLRERILAAGNLKSTPPGMDGLGIVAKHHLRLQSELVKLLSSLDARELGPWAVKGWNEFVTESQAQADLHTVIKGWSDQDDNKVLKRSATAALSSMQRGTR